MRLKTLRKERPPFENEGAVINGSRMDLSNSEYKPPKPRSNNSFALPTSLNSELSSLHISASEYSDHLNNRSSQQQLSTYQQFLRPAPSQVTHTSSYQAIEAAYLEHGIRIQLNPSTVAVATQQPISTTDNATGRKSANSLHRQKAFVSRYPSRSSSALHYSTTVPDPTQDSRPFSALQHTSTVDFDQTDHVSYGQSFTNQHHLQSSEQLNHNCSSSSTLASERCDHTPVPTQVTIPNGTTSSETVIDTDPDMAYMSSLLQTTSGDSFRDTIRRRAGLRATFAVHRHPQTTTTTTTTTTPGYSKPRTKSPLSHSMAPNQQTSMVRNNTIAVPPTTTPSPKKIEKDILKHASRIRASQLKDYVIRHESSLRSMATTSDHVSSVSNSPTRKTHPTKRTKTLKTSKSISLEPLELLLAPSPHPLPSAPPRTISLSSYDIPSADRHNQYGHVKSTKCPPRTPKTFSSRTSNQNRTPVGTTNSFLSSNRLFSPLSNDERLSSMRSSPFDNAIDVRSRQTNSVDSGCYDRSSSSGGGGGDTRSGTSMSVNQVSSSVPSLRIVSASPRRSNITKKVSFEDQPIAMIVTTATYV